LQSRKTRVEAEEKLLFPKEISEGKMEANFEEAQFKYVHLLLMLASFSSKALSSPLSWLL
jgi:hypothetical protein